MSALIVAFQIKQFADTETIVVIEHSQHIRNQDVVIQFKFSVPSLRSINDQVMRLFQVVAAVKRREPASIKVMLSYMPYGRDEHEQQSLSVVSTCLHALGVTAIQAIQLHDPLIIRSFQMPLHDITLEYVWAKLIKERIIPLSSDSWCIASPDEGGNERAQRVAVLCDLPMVNIKKTRTVEGLLVQELYGDVQGKNVILVDDILDTGCTAVGASELLRAYGAQRLYGCFVHALFSGSAAERVKNSAFERVFITDTLTGIEAFASEKVSVVEVLDELQNFRLKMSNVAARPEEAR